MTKAKQDFPYLVSHPEAVYLDSAATTHKPQSVLDAMTEYYTNSNANVDGFYDTSIASNTALASSRALIASSLGVTDNQIIFVGSSTYAANSIAQGLEYTITQDSVIMVSGQDHHSNYLPFIDLAKRIGAVLKIIPVLPSGELDIKWLSDNLDQQVAIIALGHVSNVLGIGNPIETIAQLISTHSPQAKLILDTSQSAARLDLREVVGLVDYLYFSAHKVYGPQGIGVLSGKLESLNMLKPRIVGGKMVSKVSDTEYDVRELPYGLEPGTPNIAGAVGMAAGIRYLAEYIGDTQSTLIEQLEAGLIKMGVTVLAQDLPKIGLLSFVVDGVDSNDIGMVLAKHNICVRTGSQCALPLLRALGHEEGVVRVSLGVYNTQEDINQFLQALTSALAILR
jgi:cysteine sulfinate desulfinase